MQSDKHLHALQVIPQSLAAAAVAASKFFCFFIFIFYKIA